MRSDGYSSHSVYLDSDSDNATTCKSVHWKALRRLHE